MERRSEHSSLSSRQAIGGRRIENNLLVRLESKDLQERCLRKQLRKEKSAAAGAESGEAGVLIA